MQGDRGMEDCAERIATSLRLHGEVNDALNDFAPTGGNTFTAPPAADATGGKSARGERWERLGEREGVPSVRNLFGSLESLAREFDLLTAAHSGAAPVPIVGGPLPEQRAPQQQQKHHRALPPLRDISVGSPNVTPKTCNRFASTFQSKKNQARMSPLSACRREVTSRLNLDAAVGNVETASTGSASTSTVLAAAAAATATAVSATSSPRVCEIQVPRNSSATQRATTPTGRTRGGRIRVVVRKRPMSPDDMGTDCVTVSAPCVHVSVKKLRVDLTDYEDGNDFMFDDAFAEDKKNVDLFEGCSKDLIYTTMNGGSASCFAYGQTGSGKTHTMIGSDQEKGLYILAAAELFKGLSPEHEVQASLYEIYCNSLFDLLNNRSQVIIREDHNHRINICGLSWHSVSSVDELRSLISSGTEQRRVGSTTANERSSRSHAVVTIRVYRRDDPSFCGTLNFVDLAGNERAPDTSADKQTRQEGAEINKSLLALKECIRALDEKKKHVPFRGSKLTEILRDSFIGNSQTVVIANVSASSSNYEHTVNTLRYAFRVKGLSIPNFVPSKARNAPRPARQIRTDFPYQLNSSAILTAADVVERGERATFRGVSRRRGLSSRSIGIRARTPSAGNANTCSNAVNATNNGNGNGNNNNNNNNNNIQNPAINGHENSFPTYIRALTKEKMLTLLSNFKAREGTKEPLANEKGRTATLENGSPFSLEEDQRIIDLVSQVVEHLKQDIEIEVSKAVQKRDFLISKLRSENIILRAGIARLQKRAEECAYCRRQVATTTAASTP